MTKKENRLHPSMMGIGINNQERKVKSKDFHNDMAKLMAGRMNISQFKAKHK